MISDKRGIFMGFEAYKINEIINIPEFFTVFECERQSGYSFSGETHDFWECVYVKHGKVCVSADDRVYNMETGDIIFHKPLEMHKYHVESDECAKLLIFSFSFSGRLTSFFENKVFSLNKNQKNHISSFIDFIHEKSGPAPNNPNEDFNTLSVLQSSATHMFMIRNYIYTLFLSICDSFNVAAETDDESAKIFKNAVNYMNENLHLPLKIKDIAEKCCISGTGLKKIFMDYAGLGVHKYFLKLKINKATTLLSNGKSVNDTSESLGFSSQAYFSAAFKRETGLSPSEIK